MGNGIHLTLMVGPAVPVPVPREVLESLTRLQVVTTAGSTASGFELAFRLSKRSPLHTLFLVSGGATPPLIRVVIVVTVGGTTSVLMDGVMTHHEVVPGVGEGQTELVVKGKDLTAVMDYIDFDGVPYPAMPPAGRVALIVAKYAVFGLIPLVIPSLIPDVPIPVQRIPTHQGTDLGYVRRLAEEVGYVFYLEPGPAPLTSRAYWGPEVRIGVPQPALNVDMDAHTNVESLDFRYDTESATLPVLFIHEPISRATIPIPVPDVTPLRPPLGLVPPFPRKLEYLTGTARQSPAAAALLGLARASRAGDAVSATGTLDVLRYGRPLRARGLVGVRGAGQAFDGLYYVNRVTHEVARGEYTQRFSLVRNGLVSSIPRVPA